jgi:hypothetical protein
VYGPQELALNFIPFDTAKNGYYQIGVEYLRLINRSAVFGLSESRQLSSDLLDNHNAIPNVLLQQQTVLENSWKNSRRDDTWNLIQPGHEPVSPKLPGSALSVISAIPPLGKAEEWQIEKWMLRRS